MHRSGSDLESHRFRPSGRIPSLCRLHQIRGHSAWEEHKGECRPLELILAKEAHVWRGAQRHVLYRAEPYELDVLLAFNLSVTLWRWTATKRKPREFPRSRKQPQPTSFLSP